MTEVGNLYVWDPSFNFVFLAILGKIMWHQSAWWALATSNLYLIFALELQIIWRKKCECWLLCFCVLDIICEYEHSGLNYVGLMKLIFWSLRIAYPKKQFWQLKYVKNTAMPQNDFQSRSFSAFWQTKANWPGTEERRQVQSVLSSGDDFSPNQNLSFCLASCQMQSVSSSGDDLSPIFQNFIFTFCLASCQMHPCTGFRPTMICRSIRISFVLVAILSGNEANAGGVAL